MLNVDSSRALDLVPQDWELLRDSLAHEMTRWPKEHVTRFRLVMLHGIISKLCRGPRIYKSNVKEVK